MIFSGITLENTYWSDEFDYEPVAQVVRRSENQQALFNFEAARPVGRSMTLTNAWVPRSVVIDIEARRAMAGGVHRVELDDGREFDVIFDRSEQSVVVEQIEGSRTQPAATDRYSLILRLLIINEIDGD